MTHCIHTVTIKNIKDLEACCRRWRELGADDGTPVVIENDHGMDVTGSLQEHGNGQYSVTLDQFPA